MDGHSQLSSLIQRAKARGDAAFWLSLIDALEPAAPIFAQGLLVTQPLANLLNGADALRELAELLEAPDGINTLRQRLADASPE